MLRFTSALLLTSLSLSAADSVQDRIAMVTNTPSLVAFWDFTQREAPGKRFTAHVPAGATNDYPLDAGNYVKDLWNAGPAATYDDFPLLGSGPFGQAIRIKAETNPDFRPLLFVPRARLHDSPLDIKGANRAVTVVVWAIRERTEQRGQAVPCRGRDKNRLLSPHLVTPQSRVRPDPLICPSSHDGKGSACL